MTRLTAGFICAPETGPSIVISTNRIAPVATVLPSKAMASFPPDRCSAMIPEPITVANRKKAPTPSAARRLGSEAGSVKILRLQEVSDPLVQRLPRRLERGSLSLALDRGRIRDAPMRAGRVARPDRADLAGGIIANGDHMIEDRCLIAQKLV